MSNDLITEVGSNDAMRLGDWVFRYCERGTSTELFAEPLNAASNLAFLIVAYLLWRARRTVVDGAIAAGSAAVAAGSAFFHLVPTRLGEAADVVPIGLLMAGLGWALLVDVVGFTRRTALMLLVALATSTAGATIAMAAGGCRLGLSITDTPRYAIAKLYPMASACLNGGWAYVPPAIALWLLAFRLHFVGSRSAAWVAAAACAFTAGLIARSLDFSWCAPPMTLHALWHLAAAVTIFVLGKAIAVAATVSASTAVHRLG